MLPEAESSGPIFHRWYLQKFTVLVLITAFLTSCHRGSGSIAQEQVNLAWLGHMYAMYISQNKGEVPKSIDDLRKFVERETKPERLGVLKVASVSELFVSPRDGKPFTMVAYDKPPATKYGEPSPVVLYESEGKDGRRAVAFLGGGTRTIDEADVQKMVARPPKRGP